MTNSPKGSGGSGYPTLASNPQLRTLVIELPPTPHTLSVPENGKDITEVRRLERSGFVHRSCYVLLSLLALGHCSASTEPGAMVVQRKRYQIFDRSGPIRKWIIAKDIDSPAQIQILNHIAIAHSTLVVCMNGNDLYFARRSRQDIYPDKARRKIQQTHQMFIRTVH